MRFARDVRGVVQTQAGAIAAGRTCDLKVELLGTPDATHSRQPGGVLLLRYLLLRRLRLFVLLNRYAHQGFG